jgi:hypothetical protein
VKMVTLGLALSVALWGCAAAIPPQPDPFPTLAQQCLPPGVPGNFSQWPVVSSQTIGIPDETGTEVPGSLVAYRHADQAVIAVWVRGTLVYVDPAPQTQTPPWVDAGHVNDAGRLLVRAGQPCQWVRGGARASAGGRE